MLKMKLYVCRNLCENFRQIGQIANEEVIAYTSWVVSCDPVQLVQPVVPHTREGRVMVQCIDFLSLKVL